MNIYIFIVIILILLYININYNRENYVSNLAPIKSISAHFCDKPLDIITDNETRTNIGNFCKTHPTSSYFDKISTLIIPDKTMINKKQIKILNTKNLKIMKLFSNTYNENKFNTGKLLREQNLMKLEALSLCSNDALCEAVSIEKNINNIGKAKFWTNGPQTIDTQKTTVYSKKYNYEYSVVFWIKINNLNRNYRNIFHHGSINKHRFPGIWIKPNSAGILFAISTTEKNTDTYGESVSIGNVSLNKWHHIAITVKDKTVTTYLDGSPSSKLDLIGDILWPYDEKVYIADPWHAVGNFELSKFKWIGIEINKHYIENLAYSTIPEILLNTKNTLIDIPGTITFHNNNWRENLGSNHLEKLKIKKEGNIIFIDGCIHYSSNIKLNDTLELGTVPLSYTPDRDCSFPLYIKGGYVICTIQKNSLVLMTPTIDYKRNELISLSNIRYPMVSSDKLDKESNISYSILGGLVFLTGRAKFYMGCYKDCKGRDLPKKIGNYNINHCRNKAIKNNNKYYGLQYQNGIGKNRPLGECWVGNTYGSQGKASNCKTLNKNQVYGQSCTNAVYKVVNKLNNNIKPLSIINSIGINDENSIHKIHIINDSIRINHGSSTISLEGVHWSIYNGEDLKLHNHYKIVNDHAKPTVIIDNNIVKLTGTLVKYYRKPGNTEPETITILHKKYRPHKTLLFVCFSQHGSVRIRVKHTGEIVWEGVDNGNNTNNKFSLDNIIYLRS